MHAYMPLRPEALLLEQSLCGATEQGTNHEQTCSGVLFQVASARHACRGVDEGHVPLQLACAIQVAWKFIYQAPCWIPSA